jgi:uncharacterized protein
MGADRRYGRPSGACDNRLVTYPPDRRSLRKSLDGLSLFRDVFDDPIGRAVRAIAEEPTNLNAARLVSLLAEEAELYPEELVGDAWHNHLLDRVLLSENVLSRKAERTGATGLGDALRWEARHELGLLQTLYEQGGFILASEAFSALGHVSSPGWRGYQPLGGGPAIHASEALAFKQKLGSSNDWPSLLDELVVTYAKAGTGIFGRYRAFRWVHGREGGGRLEGVEYPDSVRLQDLVGYEHEREPVVRNAERFAAGLPANNVLLYGERGTGKSSTVKALLGEFGDRGLRLIEISKEHLDDFHDLMTPLRNRHERFILYVDDLSFEEQETHYKALKAILEGGIESRPENVVLYATSNRRHLVRERFMDRDALDDDVHMMDTLEEKLSLSDRFGIRVTFGAPDQDRYLEIVEALVRRRKVNLPVEELHRRALLWAQRQNGRSGRTARQFVDDLSAELGIGVGQEVALRSASVASGAAQQPRPLIDDPHVASVVEEPQRVEGEV